MLSKAQIKHFQSLKLKKSRQNYDEFIVEGHKLTTEALLEKADVQLIIATADWIKEHLHPLFTSIPVEEATVADIEKISSLSSPQPVLAVLRAHMQTVEEISTKGKWTLVLDGVSDPGNFGTIIRSADWFGIRQIVCSEDCVELYNPKVIQATMGSLFRVKVVYTDLVDFIKAQYVRKYATTLTGENIHTTEWTRDGIVVTGSESNGISQKVLDCCDLQITIPGAGKADSLNAAVATAIVLSKITSRE